MDIETTNTLLAQGKIDAPELFPRLEKLKQSSFIFNMDFGLSELPREAGILLIRGARQYGKSTWLESQIRKTIMTFGPGTAYALNGEDIPNADQLEHAIQTLIAAFPKNAPVQRIFIDEITAIPHWEIALKKLADRGKLSHTLIVTTGSKTTDLRRGAEKLPGRKGKLSRTVYLFLPLSYHEFHRVCSPILKENTLLTYLLSGGSPIACAELAAHGILTEYVVELTRDWVEGEIAASGRSRASLLNIMHTLFRFGGSPLGQAKLAREAGLANNTVASGYIELLNDLGCVIPAYPWDPERKILILRKECKYHFTNLLSAIAYHPARIRSIQDFLNLPEQVQGMWYEWLIAQELVRRTALQNTGILTPLAFWQDKNHEIDFVASHDRWIEVKRGQTTALEFGWFSRQHPQKHLTVLNSQAFETHHIKGMSIERYLLEGNTEAEPLY